MYFSLRYEIEADVNESINAINVKNDESDKKIDAKFDAFTKRLDAIDTNVQEQTNQFLKIWLEKVNTPDKMIEGHGKLMEGQGRKVESLLPNAGNSLAR